MSVVRSCSLCAQSGPECNFVTLAERDQFLFHRNWRHVRMHRTVGLAQEILEIARDQ
jgi:predicted small metal-binding protein